MYTNRMYRYQVVLSTDRPEFMGHARIDESVAHFSTPSNWDGRDNYLQAILSLLFF